MTINPQKYIGYDPTKPQYYKQEPFISYTEIGIDVTGSEVLVQDVIDGCLDWVIQYTGLDLQSERRESIDGNGQRRILLKNYPCQALLDVQLHTRLNDWIDITAYCRLEEEGELILVPGFFHWTFPEGTKNVRVRYLAGLTKLHPLMRMVVVELSQLILLKYGILGAANLADNPAILEATAEALASGSTNSTNGIKEVQIKSLAVTFTDDSKTLAQSLRRPDIKRNVINKLMDDLVSKDPSYMHRLNIISKSYVNG